LKRLAILLLLVAPAAHALPTLDIYGGRTDVTCAVTLPYFHVEQIGNKWWFCTPLGHGFISMSIGIGTPPNPTPSPCTGGNNLFPIILTKYGDANFNWVWQTLKRVTHWGFNSVGQDSVGFAQPLATCSSCVWPGHTQPIPLPYIIESKPAENAYQNVGNFITSAIKDSIVATNSNWKGYRGAALFDVFDPGLSTVWAAELADHTNPGTTAIRTNSPWVAYVLTDDSDFFSGAGATPDFVTGKTAPNPAWTTLLTSPVQTYNSGTDIGNKKLVYTITQNFSKTQALNPVTTCSISAPCSLRDYLKQKYTTIGALNTAWGSTYTTFDSTATQVTAESFGTGDGTTTTFTHTAAHGNIDPFSIQIFVGGVDQMGDCPWVHVSPAVLCFTSTANTGTLGSSVANLITPATSTINYTTGAVTINFVSPPANTTPITISYQYGGWMQGGTGLMDESGANTSWVGTNSWCLEGPNPSYAIYTACKNGGGGFGAPNANANLGADLDNWVSQLAAEYFQTMRTNLVAAGSHLPYFGLDVTGSYGVSAFSKFDAGEAPYVDGFFTGGFQHILASSQTEWLARLQYHTQYIGNKPFTMFNVMPANIDSDYSCKPTGAINYPSQAARGQGWFDEANDLFTIPSFNNTIQAVGLNFWVTEDFQNVNQGLVSLSDNAYDGQEAGVCSRPCDAYYTVLPGATCGGEQANYGDAITSITAGNALWLQ
jgi:hypothetical protein